MKRQERGITGRPIRLVREGVPKAFLNRVNVAIHACEVLWSTYVGIIVLAQDVEHPVVDSRPDVVELVDVGMFDPVDQHLNTDYDKKRREDLARKEPRGPHCEAVWQDRVCMNRSRTSRAIVQFTPCSWHGQASHFNDIAHTDDEQNDP